MTPRFGSASIVAVAATALAVSTVAATEFTVSRSDAVRSSAHRNEAMRVGAGERGPDEAKRAIALGRFLHASLILREHFDTVRDTTPAELLLAAQAEGGWGNWERVDHYLSDRNWLDTLENGAGWNLLGRGYLALERWQESARAFAKYLTLAADAPAIDRGLAELRRAQAHTHANQYADATAAYESAVALLPAIAGWIALEAAGAAALSGDTARVTRWLTVPDDALVRERGWAYRVEAVREAGDAARALEIAIAATQSVNGTSARARAWVVAGQLHSELGNTALARDAFRTAIRNSPGTSGGVDGARLLADMPGITPDDRLLVGRTYLRHGNLPRAIAGFLAYINAGAGTAADRERLRWELGRAQFRAGRYDDAERTLLGLTRRQADAAPSRAAEALFYAARSQYRDGRITLARRTFMDVPARFPRTQAAAQALYLAADLDHDDGNLDRALQRFRAAIETGVDIDEVGLAYMRIGGINYQQRNFAAARSQFDAYRRRYPNGQRYVQAAYWSALASEQLGDTAAARARLEEVRRLDPFSYYGGRAADLLGQNFWDVPLKPDPVTSHVQARDVSNAFIAVDLLLQLGWTEAAAQEIEHLQKRFTRATGSAYALAEALNDRGLASAGIGIGWNLFRTSGGWNARLLRLIYPFPFRDILIAEAQERGVNPFLAAGLIRQESMFNPNAVSGAGAIGLMQVMPATGRQLASRLGVRRFDEDILKHAEFNAHLGMTYLDDQLADFDGRLPLVLAAYNAGPHRVTRWQQFPESNDDQLFAERIPFAETRDYVKIVQNNARIYEALYRPLIDGSTDE